MSPTLRTATSMEVHVECAASGSTGAKAVATFKWQPTSRVSMPGTSDMTVTMGTHLMTQKSTISGQWLGANCGDMKPHSLKSN